MGAGLPGAWGRSLVATMAGGWPGRHETRTKERGQGMQEERGQSFAQRSTSAWVVTWVSMPQRYLQ